MTNYGLHQWTQKTPYMATWIKQNPSPLIYGPQNQLVTPHPALPPTATLPMCTPLELGLANPSTILISISIPAETVFTLPTNAIEIKKTRKKIKITLCRLYNFLSSRPDIPQDTSKLFLKGFIRKDIQYSEAIRQTANTVEGAMKDFIVNIPVSCVVDLGHFPLRPLSHLSPTPPPAQFYSGDTISSGDLTEYNMVTEQFLDLLPHCELLFSQISEMDDALDRIPLPGGPLEEGVFRTIEEKMIILIKLRLSFSPIINSSPLAGFTDHTNNIIE